MKHAYLIIAHEDYPILETLLTMIDDSRNDIYLHIDRHSEDLFQKVSKFKTKHANFYLLQNRIDVYWGDISQVEVEYLLFETAHRNYKYAYYHLLSGVDLPLKNQDYIHKFFSDNAGNEFVEFWTDKYHVRDMDRKVSRYYFFMHYYKNKKHFLHPPTSLYRNTALLIQKLLRLKRKYNFKFKKGGNWVSITHDFCEYLLQTKKKVLKRFRFTLCPDEIFLQTILWNSPFRKNIYSIDNAKIGSMRLIDWQRGKPYVWTDNNLDELMSSEALFARKFSSNTSSVHQRLKTLIANE